MGELWAKCFQTRRKFGGKFDGREVLKKGFGESRVSNEQIA
jgi:hypothetical protein